ncbi:hypothetical protein D3C85_1543930 [compost metagenome]
MIEHVYQHINGGIQPEPMSLDQMFAWNIRFQVLTYTEEQRDYLFALQLMYGREIQIDTWEGWETKRRMQDMAAHYDHSKVKLRLLPIVFTTFKLNLRGL